MLADRPPEAVATNYLVLFGKMTKLKLVAGLLTSAAIAATSLAAFAQTQSPPPQPTIPRTGLTREQQLKFKQLQENTIAQIEAVLTPEQRTQFAAARQRGQGLDLQNLSEEQRTQITEILLSLSPRIEEILRLTPQPNQL
jgi:Spy/CpxP family protein refolding chaperone